MIDSITHVDLLDNNGRVRSFEVSHARNLLRLQIGRQFWSLPKNSPVQFVNNDFRNKPTRTRSTKAKAKPKGDK